MREAALSGIHVAARRTHCSVKRAAAMAIFCTAVLAVPVHAQTVVATDVTEDATEANSQPKIGIDVGGRIYLTFAKPSGGYSQIFVASSTDGRRWDLQQVTRAKAHGRYPALAVGPDDTVHLAWTQYDNGIGKVYYSRYTVRGWSAPRKVSPGDTYAGVPSLAVDAQRTVHLVWYGIRAETPAFTTRHGSTYEILYTAARDGRWQEPTVISPGIPDSVNPVLVIDATGRLHSAWYQFDLRNYQVRHTLYERAWGQPETISSGRADAMAVTLAAGPDGTVAIVWERRDSTGSHIYFAERAQRWSGPQLISAPSENAYNPSVAVDARGRVYVAWDGEGQIYLRRRDGAWLGAEKVTRDVKNTHPIIAAARGTVLLMWTQQSGDEARVRVATVAEMRVPSPQSRPPWGLLVVGLLVMGYVLFWAAWQWRRRRKTASHAVGGRGVGGQSSSGGEGRSL